MAKVFSPAKIFSYVEYRDLVVRLATNNSTTGEITPERIDATKLNAARMKRIERQVVLREDLKAIVQNVKSNWEWTVLAEAWCGDGAQNIPVIAKIASLNPRIKLTILLRDENPELMNLYLTNGTRSIPKLICINRDRGKELGTWGSRPKRISDMVSDFKAKNPGISHSEFVSNLHLWYARDKGESLQEDFLTLILEWIRSDCDNCNTHNNSTA